jgi:DNA invertase Pin-like site-specific DNA recombinase
MDIKENNMNKVYSVVRVSSVSQSDNTSLTHQKNVIQNYCEMNDLNIIEIVEEVYSGTTKDRDGLNYLMDKVKNGECDTIVVYKIDRLMRDFRSGINYIGDLMDLGCKIISTKEQIDTSSISGKFFLNMLLSLSEMDISTIKQRLNNGKEHRFLNEGKMVCSSPPFGYKKMNGDVELDKSDSKIVKYIFKLWNRYTHLNPYRRNKRILNLLNKKGFLFRGKSFTSQHLKRIVTNPFYKGLNSFGKVGSTQHPYPTIVSSRMFNLCNGV